MRNNEGRVCSLFATGGFSEEIYDILTLPGGVCNTAHPFFVL